MLNLASHPAVIFHFVGQSCFLLTSAHSPTILVDPPTPEIGYHSAAHTIKADAVFVSHHHYDHDYTDAAIGMPQIIEPLPGPTSAVYGVIHGVGAETHLMSYTRIFGYHDNTHGSERGTVTFTVFEIGGLRICHLSDLGQFELSLEQVREIGHVDVLMIPVGGFYTIDAKEALAIIGQLKPKVVIPMHYSTPRLVKDLREELAPVSVFVNEVHGKIPVVQVAQRDLELSVSTLPKTQTVYVLRYE